MCSGYFPGFDYFPNPDSVPGQGLLAESAHLPDLDHFPSTDHFLDRIIVHWNQEEVSVIIKCYTILDVQDEKFRLCQRAQAQTAFLA